tara:strand:- start:12990 stop:14621 length:1632 start_codon:yes stop_codon:yes gene_type:complete
MNSYYQIGDYKKTYRDFQLNVPERYNWAYEVFDKWGDDPNKIAMVWVSDNGESREVTFSEFGKRSRKVANMLTGLGAKPGDKIFVMLPRLVEWWEIFLGCMRSLTVPVPGTTLLTPKDIEYRINVSESSIAIVDADNLDKIESVRSRCPSLRHIVVIGKTTSPFEYENLLTSASPNLENPQNLSSDPLVLYFTSGTTGFPKMVMNTHSSYPIGHVITGKFWLDNNPSDLHWTLSDTGWAQAAWTALFAPWNMGSAIFIWDQRGRFDPESTMRMFEKYPISTFFAPPTAYRMLVQDNLHKYNPKALRHCVGAGEAVNPEVIESWQDGTGHHIWEGYGQTETVLLAATFPGMKHKPASMGVTAPGFYMAIVDEDGIELPPGTEGELAVRTNPQRPVGLFPGYWENNEANATSFRGDWYFTGDLCSQDEDGYFWFVGRADDVIISSSYRIGPFEVESALVEHPAVAEAAVIGKDDVLRGSIVKAFVVLASTNKESQELVVELQEHVKRVTAPYKYPREIEFLSDLPKTISGKIRRSELRRIDNKSK